VDVFAELEEEDDDACLVFVNPQETSIGQNSNKVVMFVWAPRNPWGNPRGDPDALARARDDLEDSFPEIRFAGFDAWCKKDLSQETFMFAVRRLEHPKGESAGSAVKSLEVPKGDCAGSAVKSLEVPKGDSAGSAVKILKVPNGGSAGPIKKKFAPVARKPVARKPVARKPVAVGGGRGRGGHNKWAYDAQPARDNWAQDNQFSAVDVGLSAGIAAVGLIGALCVASDALDFGGWDD